MPRVRHLIHLFIICVSLLFPWINSCMYDFIKLILSKKLEKIKKIERFWSIGKILLILLFYIIVTLWTSLKNRITFDKYDIWTHDFQKCIYFWAALKLVLTVSNTLLPPYCIFLLAAFLIDLGALSYLLVVQILSNSPV